jgi:hypothetical protein
MLKGEYKKYVFNILKIQINGIDRDIIFTLIN